MTKSNENNVQSSTPRGIEHIGITVPDHDAAVRFFQEAFGAEHLFSATRKGQSPMTSEEIGPKNGLDQGTAIVAVSLLRVHNGPNLEIFEIDHPRDTLEENISCFGMSHFSVTVDNVEAVTQRFEAAGGTLLEGPYNLKGPEEGAGNRGRFGRTPWGLLVEFESFSSPLKYDPGARAERWFPRA